MTSGDIYRIKAAELHAKAQRETKPHMKAELENLALAYIRLAEQADRNAQLDLFYETPPPPKGADEPDTKR
jgi:hypothetical protein